MAYITKQQLENASKDVEVIASVTNKLGTSITREGDKVKNIRQIIADLETVLPAKAYINEAALLADNTPADKSLGYALNTEKYYVKNGESGHGSWVAGPMSLLKNPNILFDTFNEYSYENAYFGNWDWLGSFPASFTTSKEKIPLVTPKFLSPGRPVDKNWDFTKLGLKKGDLVSFAALAYCAFVDLRISAFFYDASNNVISSKSSDLSKITGMQILNSSIVVPDGEIARFMIRVDIDGDAHPFEVGAYSAAIGNYLASFSEAPMYKDYIEGAIKNAPNLLFDPFNETIKINGEDSYQSTRNADFESILKTSTNSPFDKPVLYRSNNGNLRRYLNFRPMGLKSGDLTRVRVMTHYSGTGKIAAYFRDASDKVLKYDEVSVEAGLHDITFKTMEFPLETDHILVSAAGDSPRELIACAVAKGGAIPAWSYGASPISFLTHTVRQRNLAPDPFFRLYDAGIEKVNGYSLGTGNWSIVDYANSPFQRKRAQFFPKGAGQSDRDIDVKRLGLKLGEKLTVKFGVIAPSGGEFELGLFFRKSDNSVILPLTTSKNYLKNGVYTEVYCVIDVNEEIFNEASYLQIRTNVSNTIFENGLYICALGIYAGDAQPILSDEQALEDEIQTSVNSVLATSKDYRYGEWFLRETRERTRKRILNESEVLTIAAIGDSWTHYFARWSGPTAVSLIDKFGDAGGGWLGFGTGFVGGENGNIRPDLYTFKKPVDHWTYNYAKSVSPDLCDAQSSASGDKILLTGPASPSLSAIKLYYIATNDGNIRYRWNGGSWTNLAVQGIVGNLYFTDLINFPTSEKWQLEIEVLSGTVRLCGVNYKSNSDGVIFHKLGATGSKAEQWAAVNKEQWEHGLSSLAPNLVTIMLGTNDQASRTAQQFAADMTTIIDRVRETLPVADIFVIMPAENMRGLPHTMASYSAAMYDVCVQKKVAFMDLQYVFGDYPAQYKAGSSRPWFNVDGVHPEPSTGGRVIVDAVLRALLYS